GVGGSVQYELPQFLGIPGATQGFIDAWGIDENGLDNLGADRRALTPEEDFRGRVLGQHRQRTDGGWQITGELGLISDRNFLEQYYEREWDQEKDQVTGIEFKRLFDNSSFNVAGYFQVNDFFTQTEWLPRVDYFQLGQPLFGDQVTWLSHSHVGYAKMEPATRPLDPVDAAKFNPLRWEAEREGLRAGTRNELDFPVELGAVKVVPYVLGEAMHWGETLTGDEVTRLFGQAGVRASLPMWRIDPSVQNVFFNLNGLAHKVVFEAEFSYADADQNLDTFPLYDPLDDDSQEHFRRRFVDDTFGGLPNVDNFVPIKFDERFFAFRSGMQSWVTAPSAEIVDDLMLLRLGARQRWQTKRGIPGRYRIVDWMTLDLGASLFPEADRDNFGSAAGLLNYDWRWHLGDRFTLTSDGFADVFSDGLRTVTLGGYTSRPERGSLYLGV
ncbi:MAG TPA: organic solvent tolerance protein OstA, partial [Pirellulaceae bacterium]